MTTPAPTVKDKLRHLTRAKPTEREIEVLAHYPKGQRSTLLAGWRKGDLVLRDGSLRLRDPEAERRLEERNAGARRRADAQVHRRRIANASRARNRRR